MTLATSCDAWWLCDYVTRQLFSYYLNRSRRRSYRYKNSPNSSYVNRIVICLHFCCNNLHYKGHKYFFKNYNLFCYKCLDHLKGFPNTIFPLVADIARVGQQRAGSGSVHAGRWSWRRGLWLRSTKLPRRRYCLRLWGVWRWGIWRSRK